MNNVQILASLDEAVQAWLENQCLDGKFWPQDLIVGEITAWLMARAAFTVLEGMADAQSFGMQEGLLKKGY